MVISDINILCVGEKKESIKKISGATITAYNRNRKRYLRMYHDRYKAVQKIKGIWYKIEPTARDEGDYTQEFLDLCSDTSIEKHKIIFINNDMKKDFLVFIAQKLDDSPIGKICFFADLQGYEEKRTVVDYNEFLDCLAKGDLCFNTVYEVRKN